MPAARRRTGRLGGETVRSVRGQRAGAAAAAIAAPLNRTLCDRRTGRRCGRHRAPPSVRARQAALRRVRAPIAPPGDDHL